MGIMKHRTFDGYAYPLGTFDIAPSVADKVREGRFCKLNADGQIVFADKGKKGYLVVFPNRAPKKGFATCKGAFLVGPYGCTIDEDTYDSSKTYKPGDLLSIGDEGKLTNAGATNDLVVATVARAGMISGEGKKCIEIFSVDRCLCKPATVNSSSVGQAEEK